MIKMQFLVQKLSEITQDIWVYRFCAAQSSRTNRRITEQGNVLTTGH